jgi:hypothetical protein
MRQIQKVALLMQLFGVAVFAFVVPTPFIAHGEAPQPHEPVKACE